MLTKKTTEALVLLSSLVAVAALNYTLIHNPFVFVMTFILLVHELGHYLAAKRYGVEKNLPFFIPLPFFSIGVTFTQDTSEESRKAISIAGAFTASLSLLMLIFFNFYYKVFSMYLLLSALFGEIFFNYIGIDGQKYRGWVLNKKEHLHQHIETKFSKEKLWKAILKNPNRLKTSKLILKTS
jgi:Zn-dependent protease